MSKLKKIPVILNKRIFQKLFRISEVSNLKKEEYMLYERALMDKWDAYAVKKTAQDKLKAARDELKTAHDELKTAHDELKSVMEAAKKSLQEGKKKGLEEGLEKGKAEVVCNLIRKFGFNDERAADAAGVSIGFVKKIRASMKKKK
jgi:flagellar biosynthesis/type III secretory pathway protein FliH